MLAFTDRNGRSAMKVYTYHLLLPLLRFHWMRKPRKSNPALMCTIRVLALENRNPSGAST